VIFTLSEFAAACSGEMAGSDHLLSAACIDSRLAGPDSLFFALAGSRADGHDFVDSALEAGARAVVSRSGWASGVILVHSVEDALLEGAAAMRSRLHIPVVAVTGSSGKTTTREMIRAALSAKFRAASSSGNLNNSIGLPLSILNLPPEAEAAVFELGMNHAGELAELGRVATPDCAVITSIGSAHIEFLGTREGIAAAKAELLEQTRPGGFCVIPSGEPLLEKAASLRGLEVLRAGAGGDVWLEERDSHPLALPWGIPLRLSIEGRHNYWNALIALAVAWRMGVQVEQAVDALAGFRPVDGRGTEFLAGVVTVIDESYNANPESMTACLDVLAARPGRRIAVLGDMLELGDLSASLHEDVLRKADGLGLDGLILVGLRFREARGVAQRTATTSVDGWKEALQLVEAIRLPCTVLVKGSHAMQLELLVEALRREGKCSTGCCTR
jgi:UDP-N-acetylmuramoyl-tripeptide--D-alanyl-D-alanine ligase